LNNPRKYAKQSEIPPNNAYPYRWTILLAVWMTYLTVQILRLSIGPIAPFLKESLNLSNTGIGLLNTATGIIYLPAMAVSGWIADRIGVRRVLIFGTVLGGLAVTGIFFFPSYNAMLVLMSLSGIGFGCIFATAVKGITLWFPSRERATALGFNQTGVNIAGVIGASLFPAISIALGWKFSYLFTGIAVLAIGAGGAFLYRDPPATVTNQPARAKSISLSNSISAFLRRRDFWLLASGTFFIFMVEFAVIGNLVLYLTESMRFNVIVAGTVLALTQLSGAISKPLSGFISDRMAHGRRKPVYLFMCIATMLVCIVPALNLKLGTWAIFLIFLVLGAASIGSGGIYTTLAGELSGKELVGTGVGTSTAIAGSGILIGPPLFGLIVDRTGSYQLAWVFLAVCGLMATVLISLIKEKPE